MFTGSRVMCPKLTYRTKHLSTAIIFSELELTKLDAVGTPIDPFRVVLHHEVDDGFDFDLVLLALTSHNLPRDALVMSDACGGWVPVIVYVKCDAFAVLVVSEEFECVVEVLIETLTQPLLLGSGVPID